MEEVTLLADPRRVLGSRPARRLRSQGQVPAVLYGHGVDPVALAVDGRQLRTALTGESTAPSTSPWRATSSAIPCAATSRMSTS